jgi:hypothetical protein
MACTARDTFASFGRSLRDVLCRKSDEAKFEDQEHDDALAFKIFTGIAIAGGVIALGLFGGYKLRQRRFRMRHQPYYYPRTRRRPETGEYEAVGI